MEDAVVAPAEGASGSDNDSGLDLVWTFGYSSWIPSAVHDVSAARPNTLVLANGINAALYNFVTGEQYLMMGHSTGIGSLCVSNDRTVIATSEASPHDDALVIIWETSTGLPLSTFPERRGVTSMALSPSGRLAVLLIDNGRTVRFWRWTTNASWEVSVASESPQSHIKFNDGNDVDVVTTGPKSVTFWTVASNGDPAATYYERQLDTAANASRPVGDMTVSSYSFHKEEVLSGTTTGTIIVWGHQFGQTRRRQLRCVPMASTSSIITVDTINELIVVGTQDQALRFLDFQFRLIYWFEDFNYGPINSLSFANVPQPTQATPKPSSSSSSPSVDIPEFIFGTTTGSIVKMTSKSIASAPKTGSARGFLLVKGFGCPLACLAVHPVEPVVAVGTTNSQVHLVDYKDKTIQLTESVQAHVAALAFGVRSGTVYLAVALSNGQVSIMTHGSGRLTPSAQFEFGAGQSMHTLAFSRSGDALALGSGDAKRHCVYLFRIGTAAAWEYIGRSQAHADRIQQVIFDPEGTRLLSLSKDCHCAEFDLGASDSPQAGLRVRHVSKICQGPEHPVSMALRPGELIVTTDAGAILVFRQRQPDAEWVRVRKVRGPFNTFGAGDRPSPVTLIASGPVWAYHAQGHFLGLLDDPIDLHRHTAICGHSSAIAAVAASPDGRLLLSADGLHHNVNVWNVNLARFRDTLARTTTRALYTPEEAGILRDFFSHCMIGEQQPGQYGGDQATIGQVLSARHCVRVFRALGYYPSEDEIGHIKRELCWARNADQEVLSKDISDDDLNFDIPMDAFVRMLMNHRPPFDDVSADAIQAAVTMLTGSTEEGEGAANLSALTSALAANGDRMTEAEFAACLNSIKSRTVPLHTADQFVDALLDENPGDFQHS
ncbi:Cilia- and flagella-associated protein 251 [Plasmodiophora brassicae]